MPSIFVVFKVLKIPGWGLFPGALVASLSPMPVLAQSQISMLPPPLTPEMVTKDRLEYKCKIVTRDVKSGDLAFEIGGARGYLIANDKTGVRSTPRTFTKKVDSLHLLNGLSYDLKRTKASDSRLYFGGGGKVFILIVSKDYEPEPAAKTHISIRFGGYLNDNLFPTTASGYCTEQRIRQLPLSKAETGEMNAN